MLSEVPDDWQQTTVGKIASLNDESLNSKTPSDYEFRYISIDDVSTNSINGFSPLVFSEAPSRARRIARRGDILLSTVRPYLKAFARVDSDDKDLVVSTGFAVLRASEEVSGDYLHQLIFSESFIEHLKELMTGSNYPAVKPKDIASYSFLLPPLNEQQRIAETLSSVDASIQATQAVIEQAERVKRGLMEELLTGGLGSEAIERGEVPEGWQLEPLGRFAKIQNGFAFKSKDFLSSDEEGEDAACIVRMSDFNGGNVDTEKCKLIPKSKLEGLSKFRLQKGDILVAMSGATVGKLGLVSCSSCELYLNQRVGCIRPTQCSEDFLWQLVNTPFLQTTVLMGATGNAQPNISSKELEKIEFALPPEAEQSRIAEILSSADDLIAKQKAIIEQQSRTKKGLMDDLLTGRVRTV